MTLQQHLEPLSVLIEIVHNFLTENVKRVSVSVILDIICAG